MFALVRLLKILKLLALVCIQVYMLEIYQDTLIDLLQPKTIGKAKKLDIKKDAKVSSSSSSALTV